MKEKNKEGNKDYYIYAYKVDVKESGRWLRGQVTPTVGNFKVTLDSSLLFQLQLPLLYSKSCDGGLFDVIIDLFFVFFFVFLVDNSQFLLPASWQSYIFNVVVPFWNWKKKKKSFHFLF